MSGEYYHIEFADQLSYADDIYVRRDGENVALSDLSTKEAIQRIQLWLQKGMIPNRVLVDKD